VRVVVEDAVGVGVRGGVMDRCGVGVEVLVDV
jgi:hypothetical protein